MKKRIYLAIVLLLLGSLACMQSAPSKPAHPPTRAAAQSAQSTHAITESECTVIATALNVRDCGGIDCSVIGWLEAGWIVKTHPTGSGWLYITHGTLKGYARSNYLLCNIGGLQQ